MSEEKKVVIVVNALVAQLKSTLSNEYDVLTHSEMLADNADRASNDTLFKVFRARQHSRAMIECFVKLQKNEVCILVNKTDFEACEAFKADRQQAHTSRYRYRVTIDSVIDCISALCHYDSLQTAQKQTAQKQTAQKQTAQKQTAQKQTAQKQTAQKQTAKVKLTATAQKALERKAK